MTEKVLKMIRTLFNRMLLSMGNRYDYDVGYMQDILKSDLRGFLKYMGFQSMSSHKGNLPPGVLLAARLRAIIRDDCGPCTQLMVNMALEEGVKPEVICALAEKDFDRLPDDLALVARFTELVLDHNLEADTLRKEILGLWGAEGLIAIAYGISSSRVYPALKYAMGYGKACVRIDVDDKSLAPCRT